MNKQELIERIEGEKFIKNNSDFEVGYNLASNTILGYIKQLYEPEKVKVPQFVADWYEENKDDFEFNVWDYAFMFNEQEKSDFKEWFNDIETKSFQTLVNMHQFGYEVEKEKRYLVKMKGLCGNHETLNCEKHSNDWLFSSQEENSAYKTHHTRKELEDAGFGWVFDCKGIEIEEVTE